MRTCLKQSGISLDKYAVQLAILACLIPIPLSAQERLPQDSWETVTIDTIEIGYGLQIDDVNGDGKPDIILADKSTVQWYENPSWNKHVIARDLTERDNVCVA
ncbi:MAG: FG-GAP repeat domain-containing protein, partial [Rubripirellula sp.]